MQRDCTRSEFVKEHTVQAAQDGCQHLLLEQGHMAIGGTLLGWH